MRLVVPHTGELQRADARIVRLAHFFGISCEPFPLDKNVQQHAAYIEKAVPDQGSCFVVNPQVMREWTGDVLPAGLVSCLMSRFPFLLVHGLTMDPFGKDMIAALSSGRVHSVHPIADAGQPYEIASNSREVCGAFSGLSFGPINPVNDRVFSVNANDPAVRKLISIGGSPFMAGVKQDKTEILFLAGADILDLNDEIGDASLSEYFSRFVPHAMALRYIFGEECWHSNQHHATLIIDDPLLRKNYGFLNYERLLGIMDEYNFHTSIAFIPHNCRRNSPAVTRMFRERPDRYSICFHGNDHTAGEFATKDAGLLNAMLTVAEERMDVHQKKTGIQCDKVMVFPQGNFSRDAMDVLKAHNFSAAVNSRPYPVGDHAGLTLTEFIEPAILKYGGFPLFLRKYVREIALQDIAFNLFFGKPVLIVEHHDIFKDPECLTQLVSRIHTLAPEIRWSNLRTAVENSYLSRRAPDGTIQIRAYSNAGRIENASDTLLRCSVEWPRPSEFPVDRVLLDGMPWPDTRIDDRGIRLSFDLPLRESRKFSVVYRNDFGLSDANRRVQWKAKAFLRRRLSEFRDNHLSKKPRVLALAQFLNRRLLKGRPSPHPAAHD